MLSVNKITLLLIVATIGNSKALPLNAEADAKFEQWLIQKVTEYGKWIQETGNDPSDPIPDVITLSETDLSRISLNCSINNQVIKNHSVTTGDVALSETSFANHYVGIGREVHQTYEFFGDFNCTGTVRAGSVENNTDLQFQGVGKFSVPVNSSDELVELLNVGVTEDNKFDLTHSWLTYILIPDLEDVNFVQDVWSPGEILNYMNGIKIVFKTLYRDHLLYDKRPQAPINPSRRLMERYVLKIIGEADLADILEGDLPPPYSPTPSTTRSSILSQ